MICAIFTQEIFVYLKWKIFILCIFMFSSRNFIVLAFSLDLDQYQINFHVWLKERVDIFSQMDKQLFQPSVMLVGVIFFKPCLQYHSTLAIMRSYNY